MWFLTFGPPPVLLIFFTVSTTDPYLAVVIGLFDTAYPREDKENDATPVVLSSLLSISHFSGVFSDFFMGRGCCICRECKACQGKLYSANLV